MADDDKQRAERKPLRADLSGQVAIVTGASQGIGRAIAETLAANGASVALVARSAGKLADVAAAIHAAGGKAEVFPCDVMKADAILRADDGNATTQTEVLRLTAGETLTVQSDAFGGHEIFLHSGGDVLLQSKLTSGHLIDVRAGLGPSGIGSVITMSNRLARWAAGSSDLGSLVVAIVRMSSRWRTPSSVERKSASDVLVPLPSR